jgi:hypothetical protein
VGDLGESCSQVSGVDGGGVVVCHRQCSLRDDDAAGMNFLSESCGVLLLRFGVFIGLSKSEGETCVKVR